MTTHIIDKLITKLPVIFGNTYSSREFKGELQRQNKLISFERPFKILQNETKYIKISQVVLEIFYFINRDLDNSTRKNDKKTEDVVFRGFAQTEEQ